MATPPLVRLTREQVERLRLRRRTDPPSEPPVVEATPYVRHDAAVPPDRIEPVRATRRPR